LNKEETLEELILILLKLHLE